MARSGRILLQIVPGVSSRPDGVTDYALNLAKTLWANYELRTLFAAAEASHGFTKEGFEIISMTDARTVPVEPAHVILHYVNYGYHKRGLPFSLLPILRRIRQSCAGRLLVIFHELFATGPPWKSEFWLQPLQKKIARDVAQLADGRFVSSESARQTLNKLAADLNVVVHPVPSTFGEPKIDPAQLRERDNHRWLICGGTTLIERSIRSFFKVAGAIPANLVPRNLVVVGGRESSSVRQMLGTLAKIKCEYHPAVSPETASRILSTCAFGWLDYFMTGSSKPDLLLKSSSFANMCAHAVVCAVPNVSTGISLTGDSLPGPFVIARDKVTLPPGNERANVAKAIYDWYHRNASARTLVRMVADALQLG